jgi:nucleotide-binding universal stress UspA family protein
VPEIPTVNLLSELQVRRKKSKGLINLSDHISELYQQMEEGMREILENKKKECMIDAASTQIRILTVVGSPANKIIEIANDEKVDLIIIGSNGLKGISKLFKGLGMVARTVSERASCAVIITR